MGDSIAANLFTLGFACQAGLIPIGIAAIEEAVRLNGVSVKMNLEALLWGRRAAVDEAAVRAVIGSGPAPATQTLDSTIERRVEFLTAYQDNAYAEIYREFLTIIRKAEAPLGSERLTLAVARALFKLMAYKDEYEVARLYTDGSFARAVAGKFKGDYRLKFHLAPPILGRRDDFTGRPRKSVFGPWMMTAFRVLARFRHLRGTRLDVFGYSSERKQERALIAEYRATIAKLLKQLNRSNHHLATEIAALPEQIRGFGYVKDEHLAKVRASEAQLMARFDAPTASKITLAAE